MGNLTNLAMAMTSPKDVGKSGANLIDAVITVVEVDKLVNEMSTGSKRKLGRGDQPLTPEDQSTTETEKK